MPTRAVPVLRVEGLPEHSAGRNLVRREVSQSTLVRRKSGTGRDAVPYRHAALWQCGH